jgi:MFS family permease
MTGVDTRTRRTRIALYRGLCWVYLGLHLDRQLLAVLAESLRVDLALSDRELGTLTGSSFSIVYALLGLYFGTLADRADRLRWIRLGACIWSASSILGAFANHYSELIAARAGVAVGEAIATPAAISLMAAVAGPRYRARAASVFFACAFAGAGGAAALGGVVARLSADSSAHPAWRLTMIVAGAPGLLGALYLGLFPRDSRPVAAQPGRARNIFVTLWCCAGLAVLAQAYWRPDIGVPVALGVAALSAGGWIGHLRRFSRPAYEATLARPAFRWLLLAFSGAMFVDTAASFWLFPYAERQFALTAAHIGTELGALLLAGGIVGCLSGGWLADIGRARNARLAAWVAGVAIALEGAALLFAVSSPEYHGFLAAFTAMSVASGAWAAVAATLGLDLVPAEHHGSGVALYFLTTTLFGPSLGPYLIGLASDRLGSLKLPLTVSAAVTAVSCLALLRLIPRHRPGFSPRL